jgi:hypothetical protein
LQIENLRGLYFDGKKSDTKTAVETTDGMRKHINVPKEHLVLIQEPGNNYVGHVTPEHGKAEDTCESIMTKLTDLNVDLSHLCVLGGDGCNLNTGWKAGVMRYIEEKLNRALVRAICLLHLLEILLHKVFIHYYGLHKGPEDFPVIGPKLKVCHTLPVVKFKRINLKGFPKMVLDDLSRDQKYLFAMASAVRSGKVDPRLANYTPGPLNHARWLTTAARCLRLYVSEIRPSKELIEVVTFIMRVYVPMWQAVKMKSSISMGSKHFFNMIRETRQIR